MVEGGVNRDRNREAGHECEPAPIAGRGPRASSRPSRTSPSWRRGAPRCQPADEPQRHRRVDEVSQVVDVLDEREASADAEPEHGGVHEEADPTLPQDGRDKARLERLLGDRRDVAREHRTSSGRTRQSARHGRSGRGWLPSAPAAMADRTERDPHQLEAVHQLQEREQQQHRQRARCRRSSQDFERDHRLRVVAR